MPLLSVASLKAQSSCVILSDVESLCCAQIQDNLTPSAPSEHLHVKQEPGSPSGTQRIRGALSALSESAAKLVREAKERLTPSKAVSNAAIC